MADSTLSHLNYGHAGTSTFDIDTQNWAFARQFTATTLKQIGIRDRNSIDAIRAPVQLANTGTTTRQTDAKHNAKALFRNYPQLTPANDLLPDLAAASAAVLSATHKYDPLVGSLYSTGSITYTDSRSYKWDNPRRIAATVSGEAGNILRIAFLYQEAMGWGNDKSVWIRGDTLRNTETGYWNEQAAPIQQVCFSQSEDRSTLLAVRMLTKTIIFRPFYSQRPQPAANSQYYHLPPSLINAHPILTLENEETGGTPHVDVTFNPDFQLQFAVVDQNHVWSVWDIDQKRKSTEYKLSCLIQGTIAPADDEEMVAEDGWARILWVGDVNTVLVCNRRQLSIIGIEGTSFAYLPCPSVISPRSNDWILDAKKHPLLRGRFFILTSTELCLMAVTTPSEAVDLAVGPVGARVLLSWRHYRGAEDFTLNISLSMLNDDDLCVLLHSRLNDLTQTYIVDNATSSSGVLGSSFDPTYLDLAVDGPGHTLQVTMEPCRFQGDISSSAQGQGRTYLAQGFTFYKLFMLRSDLSVHESIIYAASSAGSSTVENDHTVEDLIWTRIYRPRKDVRTIGGIQEMDDFLEPEGIEAIEEPVSKLRLQVPNLNNGKQADFANRAVDHRSLYDALTGNDIGEEENGGAVDVPSVVIQHQGMLISSTNIPQVPLGTLLEIADNKLNVSDVDEASSSLQQYLDIEAHGAEVEVRFIASTHLLQLGEGQQPTISTLYDVILQNWIAPLPPHVPKRVRQHKERLARRVAAEVMLASTRTFQRETETTAEETQPALNLDNGLALPILSSQPVGGSSQEWASSQPLLTPPSSQPQPSQSQTTTPSSQHLASQNPSSFTISTVADPLNRLRKHLKFNADAIPEDAMPDGVNRLLSQWQPGADPRTYDWDASERATRLETADDVDPEQLEKARRRKERRERMQKRQNELAQAQVSSQPFSQPFTSVKPTVFSKSSPGPMREATSEHVPLPGASSQSQGFGTFPFPMQSQVEPGKFGGRLDKKKKKKNGRVSGF
ncbi:hypothetical protein HBH68_137300 [Parastagonospora nodorum]|nr:hypothetical protein HBH52_172280 [Parastagonospora nodorum]KAH5194858.1 hypothetical protein HBH68_137300 [Parastagonospora nodorum]KAH5283717.1 hypothetical protein HBI72_009990 [Parastagonospora nodorum]KAH5700240.1 hypothetical protein HBI44_057450 [Parastagonospora nodorum]KAH6068770.1 hypothetical protein HBI66_141230 [Parastagonospora nodorum]